MPSTVTAGLVAGRWLPVAALIALVMAVPAGVVLQSLWSGPNDSQAWQRACPAGVAAHLVYAVVMTIVLLASKGA